MPSTGSESRHRRLECTWKSSSLHRKCRVLCQQRDPESCRKFLWSAAQINMESNRVVGVSVSPTVGGCMGKGSQPQCLLSDGASSSLRQIQLDSAA
mmetsp:Transcript_11238/g.34630  ORF Transcript_11238/g.34630 Transcript_11238/m.34630 type:complete len:96 (+) Transcript_11238:404-691(+)